MKNLSSKRLTALLLASALTASVLAGCASSKPDTASDSSAPASGSSKAEEKADSNLTDPGTFPLVKEKVTLTVFAHPTPPNAESYDAEDGNIFAKWYEEKTNVKLDFTMAPSADDIVTTLSTMMASNDLPDILMSNNFSPEQQLLYGSDDMIIEIGDLVETNAPRIKKFWEEMPEAKTAVTMPGDKIYSVNFSTGYDHSLSWNKMYVYKPFMDKLKLAIPTTTEEMYNCLVAMRDGDANGNGKKDEIPMIGMNQWIAWKPITYLMNPFEYNEDLKECRNLFLNEDKKVYAAYTQDGYKEGLKWIAKLYKDGLIAPETFTINDDATLKNIINQEPAVVGFLPTHAPFAITETRRDDFVMVPPLKGPSGQQNTTVNTGNISTGGPVITSNCKEPEVAIRILDGLFDDEAAMRSLHGEKGETWDDAKEGMLNKNGEKATYISKTNMPDYVDKPRPNSVWRLALYLRGDILKFGDELYYYDAENPALEDALTSDTLKNYEPHIPDESKILPRNLVIPTEFSAEVSDLEMVLKEAALSYTMRFVLGQADVDKEWDKYLEELKGCGLERYLELFQQYYDAMQ